MSKSKVAFGVGLGAAVAAGGAYILSVLLEHRERYQREAETATEETESAETETENS